MTRFIGVLAGTMLTTLWLPVYGFAAQAETSKQSSGMHETISSTDETKSTSKETSVKKSDQRNVQTRGLFSTTKKKKKKSGGHSRPSEETDSPTHGELGRGN